MTGETVNLVLALLRGMRADTDGLRRHIADAKDRGARIAALEGARA